MLAYLEGKIIAKNQSSLIVVNAGLGYRVFVSEKQLTESQLGESIELCLHHHVREESDDLYGFRTWEELELFSLLLSVSGVGPKSALGILALASAAEIKATIVQGDADLLTKVAGIGKKTAGRLVLELKNKFAHLDLTSNNSQSASATSDELDALISLGYSLIEARDALRAVDSSITDSGQRVKTALKLISRQRS